MRIGFWVKRYCVVTLSAFVILLVVELLKGHRWQAGWKFSALWSLITATVFVATRIYYVRKGVACPLCADMPEDEVGRT